MYVLYLPDKIDAWHGFCLSATTGAKGRGESGDVTQPGQSVHGLWYDHTNGAWTS